MKLPIQIIELLLYLMMGLTLVMTLITGADLPSSMATASIHLPTAPAAGEQSGSKPADSLAVITIRPGPEGSSPRTVFSYHGRSLAMADLIVALRREKPRAIRLDGDNRVSLSWQDYTALMVVLHHLGSRVEIAYLPQPEGGSNVTH